MSEDKELTPEQKEILVLWILENSARLTAWTIVSGSCTKESVLEEYEKNVNRWVEIFKYEEGMKEQIKKAALS